MKVYTYFENFNFDGQLQLIELWKKSWKQNGFNPIVLSRNDCERHPRYTSFLSEIEKISIQISGKPPTKYGLACWLRWLAYSTQFDEEFYVSDYDVINHNFTPVKPVTGLHMMDHACPCIASGRPSDFEELCKIIVLVTSNYKTFFKESYKKTQAVWFNDQEFFKIVDMLNSNLIKMTRDRETFLSTPIMYEFWKKPLVHYGSALCDRYLQHLSKKFTPQARIKLIEESLSKSYESVHIF